jgi:ABC-type antimicrobial peptide transport system permease subunit
MDSLMRHSTAQFAFRMWLMTAFAVIALILAALGVYGVMTYAVRQRTREIGIRLAIGASPRTLVWTIVTTQLGYSLAGIVAGAACAFWLTRLLTSFLFGITPWAPTAFGLAVTLLSVVAGVSAWIPARRAVRIDPSITLRQP